MSEDNTREQLSGFPWGDDPEPVSATELEKATQDPSVLSPAEEIGMAVRSGMDEL